MEPGWQSPSEPNRRSPSEANRRSPSEANRRSPSEANRQSPFRPAGRRQPGRRLPPATSDAGGSCRSDWDVVVAGAGVDRVVEARVLTSSVAEVPEGDAVGRVGEAEVGPTGRGRS